MNGDASGPSGTAASIAEETPSKHLASVKNRLHIGVFMSATRIASPLLQV